MKADVIVVGAGVNGLVAAAVLARAGRRVTLVDRSTHLGGRAAVDEFCPGFRAPGLLADTGRVPERVLAACGIHLARADQVNPATVCLGGAAPFLLYRDPDQAAAALAARHAASATRYRAWRSFLARVRRAILRLVDAPAPDLTATGGAFAWEGLVAGLGVRRLLGLPDLRELLRALPSSLEDWLTDWLPDDDGLRAALAAPALQGQRHGPRAPGTTALLILQDALAGTPLIGGVSALVDALTQTCRTAGVELRLGQAVGRLRMDRGGLSGVELIDGKGLDAAQVIVTCEPRHALRDWVPPRYLPPDLARALGPTPRGNTALVRLALGGLNGGGGPLSGPASRYSPARRSAGHPGAEPDLLYMSDGMTELERTYDAGRAGELPDRPVLEVRVPSLADPSLAPPGQHVVWVMAHSVPYDLAGGWTAAARVELGQRVRARLADEFGDLPARIVGEEVLAPPDLEQRYGLPGGQRCIMASRGSASC